MYSYINIYIYDDDDELHPESKLPGIGSQTEPWYTHGQAAPCCFPWLSTFTTRAVCLFGHGRRVGRSELHYIGSTEGEPFGGARHE